MSSAPGAGGTSSGGGGAGVSGREVPRLYRPGGSGGAVGGTSTQYSSTGGAVQGGSSTTGHYRSHPTTGGSNTNTTHYRGNTQVGGGGNSTTGHYRSNTTSSSNPTTTHYRSNPSTGGSNTNTTHYRTAGTGGVSLAGSVASRVSLHSARQALVVSSSPGTLSKAGTTSLSKSGFTRLSNPGYTSLGRSGSNTLSHGNSRQGGPTAPNGLSSWSFDRTSLGSGQYLSQNKVFGSSRSLNSLYSPKESGNNLSHRAGISDNKKKKGFGSTPNLIRSKFGSVPSLRSAPSVVSSGGGYARGVLGDLVNIDMAISNFHIEFEVPGARYKPGDELSGKVIMDVWAGIDIKHVEFNVAGKGTLRMFQNASTFIERPKHEVYVDKHIILIGTSTSNRGVTLDPGRYETNFQYTLPDRLPPSVHQFDMGNGYVFDISYSVQARVCDFAHSRTGPSGSKLRIVKATRRSFMVIPLQDWHTIPGALEPTMHSDQLLLFCGPSKKEPTTVIVTMDRGIYPVGDNIRLTAEVISPGKDAIKDITAELEQQLFFDSDLIKKFRRVMIKAFDDGRNRRITRGGVTMKSTFGISLPTNIIPSYIPNCKMVDLQYTMKVKVRFKKFGGKLVIRLPVIIAPAGDSDRKDGELPLFNKPVMQFPYFSKSPLGNNGSQSTNPHSSSASDESTRGTLHRQNVPRGATNKQDNVTTKYKTSLNCCGCCLLCLGFGILDS